MKIAESTAGQHCESCGHTHYRRGHCPVCECEVVDPSEATATLTLTDRELAYLSRAIFRQRLDAPGDEPILAAKLDPRISVARMRAGVIDAERTRIGVLDEYLSIWDGEPGASRRIGEGITRADEQTVELYLGDAD